MEQRKKILAYLAIAYWLFFGMIFLIAQQQFDHITVLSDAMSATANTQELTDGHTVTQTVVCNADTLTQLDLMIVAYSNETAIVEAKIQDENGTILGGGHLNIIDVKNGEYNTLKLDEPIENCYKQTLTILLETHGCETDRAVAFYWGNSVSAGKFDIVRDIAEEECYRFDDIVGSGILCARVGGIRYLHLQATYWAFVIGFFVIALGAVLYGIKREKSGKSALVLNMLNAVLQYRFLIKQLVNRDFKTKYKRSILGIFWSFLNPLLTLGVQYLVFSTLFKSSVPYFAVYLLIGLVFYGFFNEACSLGITSITGNAALIKKVYMPKYIYPITRVISSLVNFSFSLIPLVGVMFLSGLAFRPSLFLLLFDIMCMVMFVTGMVLILSTMMAFFQDTQFLWGIASMMWMYLTPIFYPETIIPAKYMTLYHMNPLYQYITFARICIIDGVSPVPSTYLWCLISSLVVLGLGFSIFKRNQDNLVLML